MADDPKPTPLSTPTANYGWAKPAVGGDIDAWGGMLNTNLDGIDSTVQAIQTSVPPAATGVPSMDGTAAAGSITAYSRGDHVHPTDTTRYAASNPSGYQTAAQIAANYLALGGGTMGGALTLANDPATAMGAATKQYVDTRVGVNANKIINGDMMVDQRNNGASSTVTNAYTADRWKLLSSSTARGSYIRAISGAPISFGFGYYLSYASNGGYTPTATESFGFTQGVEADAIADFSWGTAAARPATLSFLVGSNTQTGNFAGAIRNSDNSRSFVFTYNIPAANTWTPIVVAIPADTAGTWVATGNGIGLSVWFDLGSGSNFYTTAGGAWKAGNFVSFSSAQRTVSAGVNATLNITGVKLEVGSIATPFVARSLADKLADCKRYYQTLSSAMVSGYAAAGGTIFETLVFPTAMRAVPTMALFGTPVYLNASALQANNLYQDNAQVACIIGSAGAGYGLSNLSFSAEL